MLRSGCCCCCSTLPSPRSWFRWNFHTAKRRWLSTCKKAIVNPDLYRGRSRRESRMGRGNDDFVESAFRSRRGACNNLQSWCKTLASSRRQLMKNISLVSSRLVSSDITHHGTPLHPAPHHPPQQSSLHPPSPPSQTLSTPENKDMQSASSSAVNVLQFS
jgi:hypothetical protein